jgi:hypothetical protein
LYRSIIRIYLPHSHKDSSILEGRGIFQEHTIVRSKYQICWFNRKVGRLFAGGIREGKEQYLTGKKTELSLAQSAYIVDLRQIFTQELGNLKCVIYGYDKVKLFSVPLKEYILVFSADDPINMEELVNKAINYIKSVESELILYPPSNIISSEKKEILRNLYESGISEEIIAEHLDLDISTVKMLIEEVIVR